MDKKMYAGKVVHIKFCPNDKTTILVDKVINMSSAFSVWVYLPKIKGNPRPLVVALGY